MAKQKKEVVAILPKNQAAITKSPAELIQLAISGGADLEKLEKLLNIQERWEALVAKKAFHKAMAAFKANPPKIMKDKKVAYLQVKYSHATLANITESISKELSKYGLSASWVTKQDKLISVTCKITHELGHSEETTLSAGADVTGSKNDIQAIGSTITYLERYTLLALTGLATFDMDDDGKAIGAPVVEYISEKEQSQIIDCLGVLKKTEKSFCELMKVTSLAKLPKEKYLQGMNLIKSEAKRLDIQL